MDDNEIYTWSLSPAEYDATVEKINAINMRAAKRGFTGRFELIGKRTEVVKKNAAGFDITKVVYETTLTGTPPSYNGWSLQASLEWDQNAGLIVRTVPGVESIDRTCLVDGKCDHCHIDRYRKHFYVVTNGTETKQVGSTCIKDFLGWDASVVFITAKTVSDEIDGWLSGKSYDHDYATLDVLAVAWAVIQADGWKPASSLYGTTKQTVAMVLDPRNAEEREASKVYTSYVPDSYKQAQIIRDWVLSDGFSGDSEYVINLKAIARAEFTSSRSIGFLVSAPQTWAKARERDLIRQAESDEIVNEHFGSVGDKVVLTVTIKSIRFIEGDFGTTTLYTMVTETGHMVKWFASKSALGETADVTLKIKGTIKKHDEYQGVKATLLTRCKIV